MPYDNIISALQKLAAHESQSKILAKSEKYQRQHALRAFNTKQKQINKKIINTRTKNK